MNSRFYSHRGFTLVEIMIVVVIIGLLAALAIPAWQKARQKTVSTTMDNDARQLAGAAQPYFMEHGASTVLHGYVAASGEITGPLSDRVRIIGTGYTISPASLSITDTFSIAHAWLAAPRVYDAEGHYSP